MADEGDEGGGGGGGDAQAEVERLVVRMVGDSDVAEVFAKESDTLSSAGDSMTSVMAMVEGRLEMTNALLGSMFEKMSAPAEAAASNLESLVEPVEALSQTASEASTAVEELAETEQHQSDASSTAAASTENLADAIMRGTVAAHAFDEAGRAVLSVLGEMTQAWGEQQDANILLEATLQAHGRDVDTLMSTYSEFASEMMGVARVGDEVILGLVKQAESLEQTGDAAKEVVRNSVALQEITGSSAQTMIRLAAAMKEGNIEKARLFARFVPELRGVKNEMEFVERYQKLINAGIEVGTKRAATFTGQMKLLNLSIGELYEDLGKLLNEMLAPLAGGLKRIVDWMRSLSDETKKWIAIVGGGALLAAFGAVMAKVLAIIPILGVLKTVVSAAFSAALISPIGLTILGIAGVIYALIQRAGGLEATWTKVRDAAVGFYNDAYPLILQFGNHMMAVWEVASGFIAMQFNFIASVVETIWNWVMEKTQGSWQVIKQTILDALIASEFALRNIGPIAELAWTAAEYAAVRFANQTAYLFTGVIWPTVQWFAGNFRDIFFTSVDYVLTVFINLGKNIRELWNAVWDYMSGKGWSFDWTPLAEGFRSTIKRLPEIAEREIGGLEQALKDKTEDLATLLSGSYEGFREQRLMEFEDAMNSVADATKKVGDEQKNNNQQLSKAVAETKKLDAVTVSSAEGLARVMEYVLGDNIGKPGARAGRGGRGREAGYVPYRRTSWDDAEMNEALGPREMFATPEEDKALQQASNDLLTGINEKLASLLESSRKIENNPSIEIDAAELG